MPATSALDQSYIWHPYTQHGLGLSARPIARGAGALLYDEDGRAIIDAISSWWVTLHGHAHPAIADAVARQAHRLEQVIFAGFTHEPAAALAAELVARLPLGLTRIFYSDDGSTAVEAALKMALQYWQNRGHPRSRIAALAHAYHGDTFGAMSASDASVFTAPFADQLFEVVRLPAPGPGPDDPGTVALLDALDQALDHRGDPLAAVIVEPLLQGAGGMRMWDPRTLQAIRERTAAHDVLLIADEVLTGFGRTGPLFACGGADVLPDMMCLSKGLTGGFLPLGVTAVREDLFDTFRSTDRRRTLFHGHSFTANPLACAAARASLALLDERCATRRTEIEAEQRMHLARLAQHPRVRHTRVLGTVAAFDLAPPDGTTPEGYDYLAPIGRELAASALDAGVLVRPLGDVIYTLPPYAITPEQLTRVYDVITAALNTIAADSRTPGTRVTAARPGAMTDVEPNAASPVPSMHQPRPEAPRTTLAIGVTGTDTGVGKTVVAAALAATLVGRGLRVGVLKPVETGVPLGADPTDAVRLRSAAGTADSVDDVCPFVFAEAVAPLVAAERAGRAIPLATLDAAFARAAAGRDAVVVEGAGGWLVPVAPDITYETLYAHWHLDVVIVAANRLGVINHALLTIRAVEAAGLRVAGLVLNAVSAQPPGLAEHTNAAMLRRLVPGRPVVSFPYLADPGHIPSLVDAAQSCGLLSMLPTLIP